MAPSAFSSFDLAHRANPKARAEVVYRPRQKAVLNRAAFERAKREIASWPGYGPTPLVMLAALGLAVRGGLAILEDRIRGRRSHPPETLRPRPLPEAVDASVSRAGQGAQVPLTARLPPG